MKIFFNITAFIFILIILFIAVGFIGDYFYPPLSKAKIIIGAVEEIR